MSYRKKSLQDFILVFASALVLFAVSGAKPSQAEPNSWVGYSTIDGVATFIKVGPQVFSGTKLFFHRPDDLIFNQGIQLFSAAGGNISFDIVGELDGHEMAFSGEFDGEKYVGTVADDDHIGTFQLYPVALMADTGTLALYSGTYEIGDGEIRTVGYEDLAGLVETRLYYSDGNDFVLMYPISPVEFLTSKNERIRFVQADGAVSGMLIREVSDQFVAPKVMLNRHVEVSFKSSDGTISGTLISPSSPGPHPAVIIAHTSVGGERHAYWMFAQQFARDGIAVLVYDRRGHGASTGGDPFNLETTVLAADMIAGFEFLQGQPNIDPHRIGLMGFSNGSWVAPLAFDGLPDAAFLSVSMASAVSQIDAERFRRKAVLQTVGVSDDALALASDASDAYYKGAVEGFDEAEKIEFARLYKAVLNNTELQAAQGFRILPTEEPLDQIFAAGGSLAWMGYSPADTYRLIEAPVSFHIGEFDENIPSERSLAAMNEVLAERPDADITVVEHKRATHGLFVLPKTVRGISQDLLYPNLASFEFAPGYIDQLRAWMRERAGVPPG